MSAFNKRMKQIRNGSTGNRTIDALQLVIPAVMLTADDLWCVTNEQANMLVKGSFEIIEGYGESKEGLTELHKEFADRGFQIDLRSGFTTPPYNPIPQRGRGVWQTVEVKNENGEIETKTVCGRCGADKEGTNYCGICGADMRPREDKNA